MIPNQGKKRPAAAGSAMACVSSRRFGPPGPKRPRARRLAGRGRRRTAVAPATAQWSRDPAPGPPQSAGAKQALAETSPGRRKKSPPGAESAMGRALGRRFGPPGPKRPRARRLAGRGEPDRRRAGDGALVARPGPGSAPKRQRQASAGRNEPRPAKKKPSRRGIGNGARSRSPLRPARPKRPREAPRPSRA